jgi:hypothetical protein
MHPQALRFSWSRPARADRPGMSHPPGPPAVTCAQKKKTPRNERGVAAIGLVARCSDYFFAVSFFASEEAEAL